jgi:hypothetical protein
MTVTAPKVNTFDIYPNPSSSSVTIAANRAGYFEVAVQGLNGQEMMTAAGEEKIELDITSLPKGMYLIRTLLEGSVTHTKWIKL